MADEEIIESDEEFRQYRKVVLFIRDLTNKGYGQFNFSSEMSSFNVSRDVDFGDLYKKHDITDEDISKFIKNILAKVNILLAGKRDAATPFKGPDGERESPKRFRERCGMVEKELVSDALKRRYFLHITYKSSVIDKFDWEVVVKKHTEPEFDRVYPTATLRLRLRKPFTDLPPVNKTDTVVFETTLDDINGLIDELKEIRDTLKKEGNVH